MNRLFLLILTLPIASFAENPFQCVDPDIAEAFLGHWHQSAPVYSTLAPADFVDMPLPSKFELVGSQSSDTSVVVVYKTTQNAEVALSNSIKAFLDDGWRDVTNGNRAFRGGFQAQATPVAATICRDAKPGLMSILATERSGRTLVSLSVYSHSQAQNCSALESGSEGRHRIPLMGDLPTLKLPENASSSGPSMGGSGGEFSSRVIVSSTLSREELLRYLGEQIQSQQWRFDTSWSGSLSSGSVWSKAKSEDQTLIGTLKIVDASDNVFNIRFSVSPIDANAGFGSLGTASFSIGSN